MVAATLWQWPNWLEIFWNFNTPELPLKTWNTSKLVAQTQKWMYRSHRHVCRSVLVTLLLTIFGQSTCSIALFGKISTWFGQIQNVQKYNLPNFEYYLKLEVAACGNSDLSCFWCAHHVWKRPVNFTFQGYNYNVPKICLGHTYASCACGWCYQLCPGIYGYHLRNNPGLCWKRHQVNADLPMLSMASRVLGGRHSRAHHLWPIVVLSTLSTVAWGWPHQFSSCLSYIQVSSMLGMSMASA